jgi:hypothetical protein
MKPSTHILKDRLARYRQIKLSVIGRKFRQDNLESCLVRRRRRHTVPTARARLGDAMVQNVLQNPTI